MAEPSQISISNIEKDHDLQNSNNSIPNSNSITQDTMPGTDTTCESELPENGYHFPPKYSWNESIIVTTKNFGRYITTPVGFFITIYGLNVIGWGGMLFLLICNAAPAMCKPSCEDINSPRRKWIEIDSQILNGLFCVTGFGTIPWRFRDLWYLMQYRVLKKDTALRRLAVIKKNWFRLSSTQDASVGEIPGAKDAIPGGDPASPNQELKAPRPPLTGIHAPPTAVWKLDIIIWAMIWNTICQAVLAGLMWGLDRIKRPGWATGFLITFGCIAGGIGSLVIFLEARKVRSIEGVPVTQQDMTKLARDEEVGILHWNNIKDKKPK